MESIMPTKLTRVPSTLRVLAVTLLFASIAKADEGMWLFNNPPTKLLKEKYNFAPTKEWLDHLQRSSVRFNSGGSGSFVSADGLVMTNHHVGADSLQKMSTPEKDLIKIGFHARTRQEEFKCVDLELNVLMGIADVTNRVNAAVKPEMDQAAAAKARRAVMNTIEKESFDKTGMRSDVVTLYHGGQYNLYQYKKYTDVRLVFAPEKDIAFFGGDPDNFEYPRYDLDVCFFRVYEDDKPAKIEHYLRWSQAGAGDDELVFVSGHPGRTSRLDTVAHLEFLRDVQFPLTLDLLRRREVTLRIFAERSFENQRRAQDELFGYQNSRKARLGGLAGLQDPAIMNAKRAEERKLKQAVDKDPKLKKDYGDAWNEVAKTLGVYRGIYKDYSLLERGQAFNSELFVIARGLLRMADETAKPNADRLREYAEAGLDSLKQQLFSEAPIYADLETVKLADSLSMYLEMAHAGDPLVEKVLAGKSPRERAAELVRGSKLADVAYRKQLADSGASAIAASNDTMLVLARLVDPAARKVRKTYEDDVDEPQRQAYGKISKARFALYGDTVYPDATFTLRLAFGTVKGYTEGEQQVPPWTTIAGAYRHALAHGSVDPFALPESWLKNKNKLDLTTPMNFVCTADIIGGNSGSPVVNRAGELVGLIFDGNIQSLVLDFAYTDVVARAVSVHSSAIREALRKVYNATELADELGR
jgi:Peptidase S46